MITRRFRYFLKLRSKSKKPDVFRILHIRSRNTRLICISLIFTLIFAATIVSNMLISWKDNQASWISQIYDSYHKPYQIKKGDLVFFRSGHRGPVGIYINNDINKENLDKKIDKAVQNVDVMSKQKIESYDYQFPFGKTESEKVADSIATVLISLSLVLFVGFVMRAVLVFTRYYMQLSADFENQRIAYLISKCDDKEFSSVLDDLRNNRINFEKTPAIPHEKLFLGLIDALKDKSVKTKNSNSTD